MSKNKETLTVVVSGTAVEVTVNENAPLRTVIPEALKESKAVGRSPDDWELKDKDGNILDLDKKIEEYAFTDETKLFLSLKAGHAG
jgi:hypothetical protein